jgi:hypothetical protein
MTAAITCIPNDAGYQRIADAVNLGVLLRR